MADPLTLKDHHKEARIFQGRLLFTLIIIIVLVGFLVTRYHHLQINRHADFTTKAEANRIHTQSIAPVRGLIYDRLGNLLSENQPSFSLNIVIERVADLDQTLEELQSLIEVTDNHISEFRKRLKQRSRRPYAPTPLRYNLSDEEIARLAVEEYRLPGLEVHAELVRHYPQKELFAHTLGYVASINERDLQRLEKDDRLSDYRGVFTIGKTGIERVYEDRLLGITGARHVETNAKGRVLETLEENPAIAGDNLTLFLDSNMQAVAAEKLSGFRGAVVALETKTGGVLTAYSNPSFNPNLFVTGINQKDYNLLRDSKDLPLFNRVLQGQYPPASTIKPMLGLAGLEHNVVTAGYTVNDPGWYQLPDEERFFRDWKKKGHGDKVDIDQAIAESCDVYFYDLAYRMGIDRMSEYLGRFGFGIKTGVDLTSESSGLLPNRNWKKKARGMPWFPGDTLNVSIGQGDMLATPMQLAVATAIIANRGERIRPRMVKKINNRELPPIKEAPLLLNNDSNWDIIIESMTNVVHGPRGTAKIISRKLDYKISGKTGTAQVIGIAQDEEYDAEEVALRNRDHALFIAFAPSEDPEIAVSVIVENGEHGSSTAAPIARAIIDEYFASKKEQQLSLTTGDFNGG
jgi:penicillin-binding protein 2